MIFEGKCLNDISDDDIFQLVNEHLGERQYLEFKLTIDHRNDDDRFETLCDIVSLANADGGYLIIGVRDDGRGHAQRFESVNDPDRIKRSILSLCLDHIEERIEGLEIECRTVDGKDIIIMKVPKSTKIPHMIAYNHNTHFVTRYYDGKREMTLNEIRDSFFNNSKLCLKVYSDEIIDSLIFEKFNLSQSDFLESETNKLLEILHSINSMKIDISEPIIQFDKHELGLKPLGKLTNVERQYFFDSPTYVKIPDEEKNNLVTFASEHHIDLKDGWSALGNLKCIKNFVKPLLTSKDEEHVGTEDEVNKYNMILEALGRYYLIKGYKEYFMFLDNIEVLTLLLENNGTYFDEDILITLYIPKGNMIFPDDIINPDQLIIDDITKNIDTYFMPIAISNIDSFPDYQEVDKSTPSVPYVPFLDLQTSEEKYREAIEEYRTALSEIFLFETYGDDEFDIIKIHQSYLKHNEKNYLPCFFLFKNKVEYIKYTITSKNNPNVIKGELNVE